MISIKNRKMLIPNEERYIGTTFDENSQVLSFKVSRYTQNDIDLSALNAKADVYHCATKTEDRADLTMEVQAKYIILHLYITAGMVATPGTVLIDLKLFNDDGEIKWSSYRGAFFVDDPLASPSGETSLTELEQLEVKIRQAIASAVDSAKELTADWLEENIGEIEGYVIDKGLDTENAAADAKAVGDRFTELENETDELANDVESIRGALDLHTAYVAIGDSYGEGSGQNNGWINKMATKLGLTVGTSLFKSSVGGAGFTKSDAAHNFTQMLAALGNGMTANQRDSVGKVLCVGGTNDVGVTTDTITQGVAGFCTQARALFPNAEVYIGMGSGCYADNFVSVQSTRILPGYMSAQLYPHCHYMHNVQYALHDRALMNPDHIHPSDAGYEALTGAIIAAVSGGYSYSLHKRGRILSPVGGTFDTEVQYGVTTVNDTTAFVVPAGFVWRPTSPVVWGFTANVKIGSAGADFLGPDAALLAYGNTIYQINVTAHWSQGSFDTAALVWFDSEGGVWIRNVDVYHSGSTDGYDAITAISVPPFTLTCPTIAC